MKTLSKYILSLLFALCFGSSFAQPYKPCLEGEIIRWSIVGIFDVDGPFESMDIVAYGDTSFNGVAYKQLFQDWSFFLFDVDEGNINWQNHSPEVIYPFDYYYIRESEDASKLYLYNSETNEEWINSDMNLQKGDTFIDYYGNAIVDSVYFEGGLKHIALNSGSTFIEAIGKDMWQIGNLGYNGEKIVNCFKNQAIFYKNDSYTHDYDFSAYLCGCYYL
ncbi:hypothetical protein FACS1894180_0740 [Bacteroidia bacterium]|nr:hypothetical protein FACS1894180_0740 [Bacteroidia bacterium]